MPLTLNVVEPFPLASTVYVCVMVGSVHTVVVEPSELCVTTPSTPADTTQPSAPTETASTSTDPAVGSYIGDDQVTGVTHNDDGTTTINAHGRDGVDTSTTYDSNNNAVSEVLIINGHTLTD